MKENRDHPAFYKNSSANYQDGRMMGTYETQGLTKREYAAVHILAGLIVRGGIMPYAAERAVIIADDLFDQLEK